jgi:hypothetical protein
MWESVAPRRAAARTLTMPSGPASSTRMPPARASWNRPTSGSSFATPQHASRRQRIGIHAAWFLARTLAQRISITPSCDIAEGRGREVVPISDPLRPRSAKKLPRPMTALLSRQEGNAGSGSARKGPGESFPSSCRVACILHAHPSPTRQHSASPRNAPTRSAATAPPRWAAPAALPWPSCRPPRPHASAAATPSRT